MKADIYEEIMKYNVRYNLSSKATGTGAMSTTLETDSRGIFEISLIKNIFDAHPDPVIQFTQMSIHPTNQLVQEKHQL